jgi:tRNA uridine 5-carboxymethylaminomethyl modification enzyme
MKANNFDCIVIGGGHAGVEAAHAAAKIGCRTALLTMDRKTIAAMSCNPAIGGLAKGQIVREIDALGGLMGLATDATGIQFKMLNRSKGPAVQSPRAQADRHRYAVWVQEKLEQVQNLEIIEALAVDVLVKDNKIVGVGCADGRVFNSPTVVIATGTFLKGQMYLGDEWWAGGRIDEPPADALSDSLRKIGLIVERLATGTPPRLDASTIDYSKLQPQPGDVPPQPFSFMTEKIDREQLPCWVTYTNEKIHQVLKDNLHRAPISLGKIRGTKPRYCPSIEAKMLVYPDKTQHRIILEPEEAENKVVYCNGLFTSVPRDVQDMMIKLLPGTENAKILRYGYGVEYDYCPPMQLKSSLETKKIEGLFLAGQINGTSGYEEAGGQGIIAGINAALKVKGREPFVVARDQAYIGVMIDDLLTKGIDEPYRMFTSRAEYRLSLRSDNADRRLTPAGREVGLVDDDRWKKFEGKISQINQISDFLKSTKVSGQSLWEQLEKPDNPYADKVADMPGIVECGYSGEAIQSALIDSKYEGYLEKQDRIAARFKNLETKSIPEGVDYNVIPHLKKEAKQKLTKFQPQTLAQVSRISGITPADVTVLMIYLKKYHGQ